MFCRLSVQLAFSLHYLGGIFHQAQVIISPHSHPALKPFVLVRQIGLTRVDAEYGLNSYAKHVNGPYAQHSGQIRERDGGA